MKTKLLPLLLISLLSACSMLNTKKPIGVTEAHFEKCREIANEVLASDKSFKPSKYLISGALKVTAERFEKGILTCKIKGSYRSSHYVMAYNSASDLYLSEMSYGTPNLYRISNEVINAHPACGRGNTNRYTYKATYSYAICIEKKSHSGGVVELHDLINKKVYSRKGYGSESEFARKYIPLLFSDMEKDHKLSEHKKCMQDVKCKENYEGREALARENAKKQHAKSVNSCNHFAKDMESKYSTLSLPKILYAAGRGEYVSCVFLFTQSSVSGDFPKEISITGNTINGAYEIAN